MSDALVIIVACSTSVAITLASNASNAQAILIGLAVGFVASFLLSG